MLSVSGLCPAVSGRGTESASSTYLLTVLITHLIADALQRSGSVSILDKELDPVLVTLELHRGENGSGSVRGHWPLLILAFHSVPQAMRTGFTVLSYIHCCEGYAAEAVE